MKAFSLFHLAANEARLHAQSYQEIDGKLCDDENESLQYCCERCRTWVTSSECHRLVTNDSFKEIIHYCNPCADKVLEERPEDFL